MSNKIQRGVSKAEWLEAGLQALVAGGIANVTVEGLARTLGIAKAGFYWHFRNRDELLQQMLDHWTHGLTEVISENQQLLTMDPKQRLLATAKMILDYDLTRYELAIRQWALQDTKAARSVKAVNKKRLDFVRDAFAELGFKGDDLEMRTLLFACYHTWESPMFREISCKRRRELIGQRIELMTRKYTK